MDRRNHPAPRKKRAPQQQQQQAGNNAPAAAAAAAPANAAAAPAASSSNNNRPLLAALLEHLAELAQQAGFAPELIEVPKAQLLLEATAGQVPLAAQLYWDDVLARTQHNDNNSNHPAPPRRHAQPDPQPSSVAARRPSQARRRSSIDRASAEAVPPHSKKKDAPVPPSKHPPKPPPAAAARKAKDPPRPDAAASSALEHRREMAKLHEEAARRVQAYARGSDADEQQPVLGYPNNNRSAVAALYDPTMFAPYQRRESDEEEDDEDDEDSDDDDDDEEEEDNAVEGAAAEEQKEEAMEEDGPQPHLMQPNHNRRNDNAEASVSVSDDEAAEMLRTVKAARLLDRKRRRRRRKKKSGKNSSSSSAKKPGASSSMSPPLSSLKRLKRFAGASPSGGGGADEDDDHSSSIGEDDLMDEGTMDEEGYLSDNDWIWESLSTTPRRCIPPISPMDFLWGVPATPPSPGGGVASAARHESTSSTHSPPSKVKDDDDDDDDDNDDGSAGPPHNENEVVIVDDGVVEDHAMFQRAVSNKSDGTSDEDDKNNNNNNMKPPPMQPMDVSSSGGNGGGGGDDPDDDEDENGGDANDDAGNGGGGDGGGGGNGDPEEEDEDKGSTIPVTWLRAGFGFPSDQKVGLSCRAPNEEDIGYLQWKQQMPASAAAARNNKVATAPYHCPSVTVLPAIVTALMQAGVTVVQESTSPTPHVTCHTTQKSYHELDATQKTREWERRLVDALTALLVIAAQSSKQRKAKALERAQRLEQQQQQAAAAAAAAKQTDDTVASTTTAATTPHQPPRVKSSTAAAPPSSETRKRKLKPSASHNLSSSKKKDPPSNKAAPTSKPSSAAKTPTPTSTAASGKWQKLWAKLQLCPTCWWEKVDTNNNNNNQQQPETNSHGHVLPNPEDGPFTIPISYTHICDLKSYVKSNLQAFLNTGGCALFLESLLRIHGKGAVQRMVQYSRMQLQQQQQEVPGSKRKRMSLADQKLPPLIRCTCQERFQQEQQQQRMSAWPGAAAQKETKETSCVETGCTNDCASVELISLLLTGRIYSSWQGWSTSSPSASPSSPCSATLGIGVLTDQPGQVGRGLTRPAKPVWIVKGPSQYSVIWLNQQRHSAAVLDSRGFVADMTHWSCWYGDDDDQEDEEDNDDDCNKERGHTSETRFRFNVKQDPQAVQKKSSGVAKMMEVEHDLSCLTDQKMSHNHLLQKSGGVGGTHCFHGRTVALLQKRRKKLAQAAADRKSVESVDVSFSLADLERVRVHPDDAKFYPENFRLWRYDIAKKDDGDDAEEDMEHKKPRGRQEWTPFHRLDKVQQLLVETKLGPKLAVVLRTRWPNARIDRMDPPKPLPLL